MVLAVSSWQHISAQAAKLVRGPRTVLLAGSGLLVVLALASVALTVSTVTIVIGAALAVAILATLVPAIQAARTSTIDALADAARPPRRTRLLIAASTRLPIPLLLGIRLAARRPRRIALGTLSVAGIVAVLIENARLGGTSGLANPQHQRLTQVLWVITIMLIVLAAINAILITWATVVDGRHASALARALGATPQQVSQALSAAQFVSVLPRSILGVPLGIALVQTVGKSSDAYKHASIPMVTFVLVGTWLIMSLLTAIPARIGTRRSTAQILQAEGN
jgi:putative ABC transport system permease protein